MQFTGFFVYSQSCKIITTHFRTCSSPPKRNPVSIYHSSSLFPSPSLAATRLLSVAIDLPIVDISYQWESYSIWPFVSSFFHLAKRFRSSSMVLPFCGQMFPCIDILILFIHSSADIWLTSTFFAIISNAAVNICLQVFLWIYGFNSPWYTF